MTPNRKPKAGFTLVEFMVVLVVLVVMAAVLLPALRPPRYSGGSRIGCANNLKQVGLAFHQWAMDSGDRFSTEVSITNGGAMEAILSGNLTLVFLVMSNELNTPKILFCPADKGRVPATTFDQTVPVHGTNGQLPFRGNSNLSYFVGLDAKETAPGMFLSGDDNWLVGGKARVNGAAVKPGLLSLWTNTPVVWSEARHQKQGNVGLTDGSVQGFSNHRLADALCNTGVATNRLVFP